MAAGIPVVGTDTFGINEIIQPGQNGLLARIHDPVDLRRQIVRVQQDRKLAEHLVRGGKKSIRTTFALKHQLDRLERIYQS